MRTLNPVLHAKARGRILDAARAVFSEQGYHGASMAVVARQAGLGKAALYHYFKSKQAILIALHEDLWGETLARAAQLPPPRDLAEALRNAGRFYLEHFHQPKAEQMTRIVFSMGQQDPSLHARSADLIQPKVDGLIHARFGPFFPPETPPERLKLFVMQFLGSLFHHIFVMRQICPCEEKLVTELEYLEQLVDIFAAGARRFGGRT
jgi:AcrR family transcriptional regulator